MECVYVSSSIHTDICTYTNTAICSWNPQPLWELLFGCCFAGSHDTAVWIGVPWAVWWNSAGCVQFDIKWEQGSRWARLHFDLTGAQISSAVVPSGCGTVLKLRAALIRFAICTVEAVLGLLGNYEHVPHSSKVDSSFPGVVIFVFV